MKIAVLGAGAMGGLFSSYLSRNNEVTVIDVNPALVEKVHNEGLVVEEPDGSSAVYHPNAVLSTEGMAPVDLIIVFVKAMFSESALNNNKGIIGPNTYLMTLQNGSGHEDMLGKFVPQENIIIGTTQHNASVAGLGVTKHGGSGMTHMGCVVGDVTRLQKFADAFTACGLDADVSDGVQKMIWNKLFTNVSASALTGALQVPLGYISSNEYAWKLCCTLIREAVDAAAGLGMDFDYDEKVAEVKAVCDNSPNGLTSIYADLRDGRRSEVDTISGSVVRAGQKGGVPTPSHEFLVGLIHAMEGRSKA
ncbi:2-dehydropantoate 2-reductase [uncultured Subdoligranulum sp.]|uniref:ketopantoate reductase family protein n=1 Tax=uncultured Subdoligranulum sp. TaxID=512298 RepID=UPI0026070BD3|nr:2-dehydropantoate 2-reductase [uncultured Subdoligranulum sp.]